ncbi:hypothetical protein P7K49_003287 [Saguinus oedipus]|uniref:Uncharacterized protein n=1 Tax=Saguinus oedipus TaxID=9490 RepID=A0ABQ9WJR3_SAGOE|nr:hypothetical protein P7K49_003287 [Saguinus oedipus]
MHPPRRAALGLLPLLLLLLPPPAPEAASKPTPCQRCRGLVDKFNQVSGGRRVVHRGPWVPLTLHPRSPPPWTRGSPHRRSRVAPPWSWSPPHPELGIRPHRGPGVDPTIDLGSPHPGPAVRWYQALWASSPCRGWWTPQRRTLAAGTRLGRKRRCPSMSSGGCSGAPRGSLPGPVPGSRDLPLVPVLMSGTQNSPRGTGHLSRCGCCLSTKGWLLSGLPAAALVPIAGPRSTDSVKWSSSPTSVNHSWLPLTVGSPSPVCLESRPPGPCTQVGALVRVLLHCLAVLTVGRVGLCFSEIRLLEILEGLCESSDFECNQMLEAQEEHLEAWWLQL